MYDDFGAFGGGATWLPSPVEPRLAGSVDGLRAPAFAAAQLQQWVPSAATAFRQAAQPQPQLGGPTPEEQGLQLPALTGEAFEDVARDDPEAQQPPSPLDPVFLQAQSQSQAKRQGIDLAQLGLSEQGYAQAPEQAQQQQELLQRLEAAQSTEATLAAENNELRRQLSRWQQAGLEVAEREAKVAELLRASAARGADSTAAAGAAKDTVSLLSSRVQTYVLNSGKVGLDARTNAYRILLIFLIANTVALLMWAGMSHAKAASAGISRHRKEQLLSVARRPEKQPAQRKPFGEHCARYGATADALPRGNHLLGKNVSCHVLELSEMQVVGLGALLGDACCEGDGSDLCLSVQTGNGRELRTMGVDLSAGDVLRYREQLTVRLRRGARDRCTFSLLDRSDPLLEAAGGRGQRLATIEVPAEELLQFAQKRHSEYCTVDLRPEAQRGRSGVVGAGSPDSGRPQLSMRMREVTAAEELTRGHRPGGFADDWGV